MVERTRIIECGLGLMRNVNKRAFWDFEFKDEIGTGLGPTMEFYYLIAEELKKKDMWRKNMPENDLFPSPLMTSSSHEEIQQVYELFKYLSHIKI